MNKETYEALKKVVEYLYTKKLPIKSGIFSDIVQVQKWIDEVAKEYIDDECRHENTEMTSDGCFCADCGVEI